MCVQGFLENSHPAVQSLESLQQRAMEEFSRVATFFGENSNSTNTEAFFGLFGDFMSKFEVDCHNSSHFIPLSILDISTLINDVMIKYDVCI